MARNNSLPSHRVFTVPERSSPVKRDDKTVSSDERTPGEASTDQIVAGNVRRVREKLLGWSRAQLAEAVNAYLPPGSRPWKDHSVLDVEWRRSSGRKRIVGPAEIVALARALGVHVSDLFLPPPHVTITLGRERWSRETLAWRMFGIPAEDLPRYVESSEPIDNEMRVLKRLASELGEVASGPWLQDLQVSGEADISSAADQLLEEAFRRKSILRLHYYEVPARQAAARGLARIFLERALLARQDPDDPEDEVT